MAKAVETHGEGRRVAATGLRKGQAVCGDGRQAMARDGGRSRAGSREKGKKRMGPWFANLLLI